MFSERHVFPVINPDQQYYYPGCVSLNLYDAVLSVEAADFSFIWIDKETFVRIFLNCYD